MFVRKYETRRARRLSRRRSASRVSASVLVREDAGRYARSSMSTSHHAVDALGGGSNADASFVFFIFPDALELSFATSRRDSFDSASRCPDRRPPRPPRATSRDAAPCPGLERRLERGEVELEIRELRLERRASKKKTPRARLLFRIESRSPSRPPRRRTTKTRPRRYPAAARATRPGPSTRPPRSPSTRGGAATKTGAARPASPILLSFSPEQGRARRRRSRRRRRQRDDVRRGERDTRVRRGRVCLRVPLALALVRSFRERLVEQPRRVSGGRLVAVRLRFLFVVARTVSRRFRRRRDGSRPSRRGDRE